MSPPPPLPWEQPLLEEFGFLGCGMYIAERENSYLFGLRCWRKTCCLGLGWVSLRTCDMENGSLGTLFNN